MHFSFSIRDTCGHFLLPERSKKCLVRIFNPSPQVAVHSDQASQSETTQSFSSKALNSSSSPLQKHFSCHIIKQLVSSKRMQNTGNILNHQNIID